MAVEETRTQRRIFRIGFVVVYAVAIAGFIHLGATSGAAAVREQLTLALTSLAVVPVSLHTFIAACLLGTLVRLATLARLAPNPISSTARTTVG